MQQCLQPGVSVAAPALRAGVNANLLRKWITKYQRALGERASAFPCAVASGLLPVVLRNVPILTNAPPSAGVTTTVGPAPITIELRGARVHLPAASTPQRSQPWCRHCAPLRDRTPSGTRVWLAAGITDMRCGFDSLAARVQTALAENSSSGHIFVFRGRRSDLIKLLWWDGDGLCLLAKRLERGRFIWPRAQFGVISLTSAQLPSQK